MSWNRAIPAVPLPPHRILLVEDQQAMRDAVAELLETDARLNVCGSVESGEDALDTLEDGAPDLAVIDLDLPGMNGFELMSCLRNRAPGVPVVVLSSHTAARFEGPTLQAGARAYVPKDRAAYDLMGTVRHVLGLGGGEGEPGVPGSHRGADSRCGRRYRVLDPAREGTCPTPPPVRHAPVREAAREG